MNIQDSRLGTKIRRNKSSEREVPTTTRIPEGCWQCDVMYIATVYEETDGRFGKKELTQMLICEI